MGYIKYIPTVQTTILNMATFSGEVQILDTNFDLNAKLLNGLSLPVSFSLFLSYQ